MNHKLAAAAAILIATAAAQERTALTRAHALEIEQDDNGHAIVAGELLVKFRDANSGQKFRGDDVRKRRYQVDAFDELSAGGLAKLHLRDKSARKRIAGELLLDADVEYVEPNYVVTVDQATPQPNDPLFPQQWHLHNTGQNNGAARADVDALAAWVRARGSRNHVIAVIDSGIDYNHPDLRDNVWSAPREFTVAFGPHDRVTCPAGSRGFNAVDNTCDPFDAARHGTQVAGVIGAASHNASGIAGVNWTASIMGIRFIGSDGRGSIAHAIRAIDFAIQARAALGSAANIRVLNNSWGGAPYSQALLDAIHRANQAGMLFVTAAGNTPRNLDISPEYPAAYEAPNVVTVSATDNRDAITSFSAFGARRSHLGAPGASILTTSPNGLIAVVSGTSFAAPLVSGVAGLVLAACPTLDTAGIRKSILDAADPLPSLTGKTSTGGRLNAFKSVRDCTANAPVPGFRLSASPATVYLIAGQSATVALTITASGGFQSAVALSLAGLPDGVTGTFTPASATPGQAVTLRLSAAADAAPTDAGRPFTIRGVSGALHNAITGAVRVVPPPSFSLAATPASATVRRGGAATYTLRITSEGGFSGTISLQTTELAENVMASFSPRAAGLLTLHVATTPTTPLATSTITVAATSGTLRRQIPLTLTVIQ